MSRWLLRLSRDGDSAPRSGTGLAAEHTGAVPSAGEMLAARTAPLKELLEQAARD